MLGLLSNMPLLSILLWLPLAFGILTVVSGGRFLRTIAVLGSGSVLILSFALLFAVLHNNTGSTWAFVEKKDLLLFKYYVGIDGISVVLVCLAALIMMICCLYACFVAGPDPVHVFLLLVLETLIFGVFVSVDLLLFYIFFEASIVPLFLIIGLAGGRERIFSAFKMFMYTIVGSILLLFAILYLCLIAKVPDFDALNAGIGMLSRNMRVVLWLALFTAFAIKLPMLPLHSWLPNAHANAPTVGSVVLAAVMLKLGSYGMLRFVVPAFPEINRAFSYPLCCISVAAVLYGALVAFVQKDLKKTIAYSSISHMGFVTAGMFAYNTKALIGSIFEMVSHGLSSAAMFLCAGFLYKRSNSRQLSSFGGYFAKMPILAAFFLLFMFAAIGVPGTSGFVSEFLVVLGAGSAHGTMVPFLVLGLVFSAVYMLSLYKTIFTGNYNKAATAGIVCDLSMSEVLLLLPLTAGLLFLGICPSVLLNLLEDCISNFALIKN